MRVSRGAKYQDILVYLKIVITKNFFFLSTKKLETSQVSHAAKAGFRKVPCTPLHYVPCTTKCAWLAPCIMSRKPRPPLWLFPTKISPLSLLICFITIHLSYGFWKVLRTQTFKKKNSNMTNYILWYSYFSKNLYSKKVNIDFFWCKHTEMLSRRGI